MKESNDGFVRADQIDLKSLDEQLERHLSKARTKRVGEENDSENVQHNHLQNDTKLSISLGRPSAAIGASKLKERQEWEIDPSKLLIKTVIARGTFGTVHRGVYDGQDVAGLFFYFPFIFFIIIYFSKILNVEVSNSISLNFTTKKKPPN